MQNNLELPLAGYKCAEMVGVMMFVFFKMILQKCTFASIYAYYTSVIRQSMHNLLYKLVCNWSPGGAT